MNLPSLAKFMQDVTLKDLSRGEDILSKIKEITPNEYHGFNIDMSGYQLLREYEALSYAAKKLLTEIDVVQNSEWSSVNREIELLQITKTPVVQKGLQLSIRQGIYVFSAIVVVLITLVTVGGYYFYLASNGEQGVSYVFAVVNWLAGIIYKYYVG